MDSAIGRVAILLATCGCAAAESPSPTSQPEQPNDLSWQPCDITTGSSVEYGAAECADLDMPARRDGSSGRVVSLSLKRYGRGTDAHGQLWLLAGGPGSAASDFEIDAKFYRDIAGDLQLYFLDHRGTGRSSRLTCENEERADGPAGVRIRDSEWSSCAATMGERWGNDLSGFNTTEAAFDLGEAITRTRRDDEPVFLYAVSYGTYLAERYLQLYPKQPTGIILDSICAPGKCDMLLGYDRQFDLTSQALFRYCAADSLCASELGSDPWGHVVGLSTALAQGHCAGLGWSSATLRQLLGFMLNQARLRDYMPAVVRRAERCSDNDVAALEHFKGFISTVSTEANSFSQVLFANIALSELSVSPSPGANEVAANVSGLHTSVDGGMRLASAVGRWPTYARDQYYGSLGPSEVPMLMLNGSLDPATPLDVARPTGDFYRNAHQHFVEIPYSPHTTLTQSIMDDAGNTCGAELASQFLHNPTAPLNLGCTNRVLPLRFEGIPEITQMLFGIDSAWSDAVAP